MLTPDQLGKVRIYNREFAKIGMNDVVLWDVMPIKHDQRLQLIFESVGNERSQGVRLATKPDIIFEGKAYAAVKFWYGGQPNPIELKCRSRDGLLSIYNFFFDGHSEVSQTHTSGMLVEEIPSGRRYRCNDYGLKATFDALVFRLECI